IKSELTVQSLSLAGFVLVQTRAELTMLVAELSQASLLTLDTETTSLDPLSAQLVGLSLCTVPERVYYIPVGHRDQADARAPDQLAWDEVLNQLRPYLESPKLPKLGHNLKYDLAILSRHGVMLGGPLWDTMIASYLLDPGRRSHKLDDLAEKFLSRRLTSFAEVTGNDKRPDCFAYVGLPEARDYSCEDARATLLLWEIFRPELDRLDLWPLFSEVEMELVPILAEMERHGIIVDPAVLNLLSVEFHADIKRLEQEIIRLAGQEFNISSPRQLGEILFEKLGLPHGRKTKTGYSTDIRVLEELQRYHDLPTAVIRHRNLSKLTSTYIDSLADQVHPKTGRIHTSFNQTVTATGRLSSSNPNLQNIPIRTHEGQRIRQAFIPAPGCLFLSADYSQIDLRVLAHYAQDPALLKAFRSGRDIHVETAAEIFRTHSAMVTTEMRRVAKTINFGIVYGMSAFGLAGQLNISRKEAATFIDRYFDHFAGVKQFMHDIVEQARTNGYVTTLLNRRRVLPDINSTNRMQREFAERTAINTPIQGTAADIIKLAAIQVDHRIRKEGLQTKMLLQIHDELVFEVPIAEQEATTRLVKPAMESVLELSVPLIVNISTGANLAET
ncbi:MAG: DNA polymerase I, partial [Deltaproteobacteria bacterium RIFOXYD12_FULL_50_9]